MPPLPGVLAVLPPSQPASKSLSTTASTTTVTTEVAGSGYVDETTTSRTATTTVREENKCTNTVTSSASIIVASTVTNMNDSSCNSKSIPSKAGSSSSSSSSGSSSSSSSKVDDVTNSTNKNCDSSDNVESGNNDADSDVSSNIFGRPQKILLRNVNAHITCNLCRGYLIDATTIVECLHSFCHSCIMNHLRKAQYCPHCDLMINTAKPNNIKSDTTLQAIVYKLVPGLYEKELLRKRAFYCTRPEEAMLATPEQRGEDTEHLIFGPTENMSLSLEYADIEEIPTSDTFELNKPKYLQCPAIFTVAHLKKFVFGKFGIDHDRFTIEIMYKVKTIVLADHYKIMDVAYIYTWKRDAPMRFFFRVKECEGSLRKRKEIKMRRLSQGIIKPVEAGLVSKESIKENKAVKHSETVKETGTVNGNSTVKEGDTMKENETVKEKETTNEEIKVEVKEEISEQPEVKVEEVAIETPTSGSLTIKQEEAIKQENEQEKSEIKPVSNNVVPENSSGKAVPDPRTEKLKITLVNKGKSSSKDEESPKIKSSSKTGKTPKHYSVPEPDDRKVENIKLKIDLSKEGSVTIINMSSPDATKKEIVKPLKPEKEWKIKVKKDKDLKLNGSSEKSKSSSLEKLVPPITIELGKPVSPLSSSEILSKEKDEEEKKSEFLNSIALAPIKSLISPDKSDKLKSLTTFTPPLPPSNFSTKKFSMAPPPPPSVSKLSTASKRKNKEPIKAIIAKKPKLDVSKPKPVQPQIKVRTNLMETNKETSSISFKLSPFPIGASTSSANDISKKHEDEKLMPAPPPLKMLDVLKKNASKPGKVNKTKTPNKLSKNLGDAFLRPMVTTSLVNSKVPIVSNVMGNRTPIARRYPPILPKSPRVNPFANIPTEVNKFLQPPATEIKPIPNGKSKEIKVYGPPTTAGNNPKTSMGPPSAPALLSASSTLPTNPPDNPRASPKAATSTNYLNYAIFNASKTKMPEVSLSCRTPIYSPNSPIYSPNSPQYMPNYNIPIQPTYKYTKTQGSGGNYLQNVFGQNKQMSNLFPAPPTKKPIDTLAPNNNNKTEGDENSLKRTKTPPSTGKISPEPIEKQTPVQSLLNSCNINIPSSLSITITNENGDANSNSSTNPKHNNPVNNYIEILKLPDSPSVPSEQSNSVPLSPEQKSTNPLTPSSSKPSYTINPPKSSPTANPAPSQQKLVTNTSPTTKTASPPASETEKKLTPSPPQKSKKSPSSEKKTVDKPSKKAPAEKRQSPPDSAKSCKDKHEISPVPAKKYRPILPRSKSPQMIASLPSKLNPKVSAGSKNALPSSKKVAPKQHPINKSTTVPSTNTTTTISTKKSESVVDLTASRKSSPPPPTLSVPSIVASQPMASVHSDFNPFLASSFLKAQSQLQQGQSSTAANTSIFLQHLAAQASFNPSGLSAVNFGYNYQQSYLLEQLTRMQKAGTEALEKYMQRLKNNNTSCAKSPTGSPGNTTPTPTGSTSDVKNSV